MHNPGTITLIGSGETSATGGQVFEAAARQLLDQQVREQEAEAGSKVEPEALEISVLETPAGFEANAQRVAGRVADFIQTRLQNYHPKIQLISARKKGTPFSPDSAEVVQPLYTSELIFFGPGSPTYTVRQLDNSLAWQVIQARQRLGASIILASAATIALSTLVLPVYEIYKVGEDPHWKPGLDFFQPYGLRLAIIPHWNNNEGGSEVDTSRCFMGQERFDALRAILPGDIAILGIDEHTALTIDFQAQACHVRGVGEVHVLRDKYQQECSAGCSFSIHDMGDYHPLLSPESGLSKAVWQQALAARQKTAQQRKIDKIGSLSVPQEVQRLVDERQAARQAKDWARADQIRGEIANLGWQVKDTPTGPTLLHEE
jgi:hypothetical protein